MKKMIVGALTLSLFAVALGAAYATPTKPTAAKATTAPVVKHHVKAVTPGAKTVKAETKGAKTVAPVNGAKKAHTGARHHGVRRHGRFVRHGRHVRHGGVKPAVKTGTRKPATGKAAAPVSHKAAK